MSKQTFSLILYVVIITSANVYLWMDIIQAGPAPRSRRVLGLIFILAVCAVFSDKFSRNDYASTFIKVAALLGMTVLFLILLNRAN